MPYLLYWEVQWCPTMFYESLFSHNSKINPPSQRVSVVAISFAAHEIKRTTTIHHSFNQLGLHVHITSVYKFIGFETTCPSHQALWRIIHGSYPGRSYFPLASFPEVNAGNREVVSLVCCILHNFHHRRRHHFHVPSKRWVSASILLLVLCYLCQSILIILPERAKPLASSCPKALIIACFGGGLALPRDPWPTWAQPPC